MLSLRAQPSDVAVLVWTTSVVLVGQIAVAFRQQKRLHRSCAGLSLLGASVHWVILGDSMLLVFLGLQTFALATYLLLGFRFLSVERARTAQKTFIVHRIGAISFFLAMVILLHTSKTLELSSLAVALQGLGGGVVLDVASILVLLAGAALAAQLPLSTWLASASTGASRTWGAIHALALVAGVGVVRRLWPLVGQSETALLCLASVGTLSAFLFSTSASAQSDARRSLALAGGGFGGLAFAQCATRGVSSALFYAMAQGWAILCLVLVAGAVRWGTAGERDLRRMGGLSRVYPWLHRSALVVLILATLTPVSGDFGALGALEIPGLLMPLCSGLAVFSLWRWYLLTFWSGGSRTEAPANPVPVLPRILVLGAALVGVLPWSVSWLFAGGPRSLVAIGALATHALALGGSLFLYGRSIHRAAQTWVVQRPWRWLHRRAVS
ncbi:MAG: proton-conducting transporter membrane subunit, partial [Myxococcota bacterium]